MQVAVRTEHISKLVDGVALIPGPMFERFGGKLIDEYLQTRLNHRGLNNALAPVSGTVDSYNDEGAVAAEYSAEKSYFSGDWDKPVRDILHVLRKHPDAKDIYLLSSQVAPTGSTPTFVARVKEWFGWGDRTLHLYDARKIAEIIVDDLLLFDAATEALVEHLPALRRILDENIATLTLPTVDSNRVERPAIEGEIRNRLTSETPVLAISGIGGSGKSDVAASYAASNNGYRASIWVAGSDLRDVTELSSILLKRAGATINVAGLMASYRCLLVIDDLPSTISLSELTFLCSTGSRVLVTRRNVEKGDYELPHFSVTEARAILNRGVQECSDEGVQILMRVTGGHPLSLALVNRAVALGESWGDVLKDCEFIGRYEDGPQLLADRLLGRLQTTLGKELTVFEWSGREGIEDRFLRTVIKTPGMAKLGSHGLLAAESRPKIRLHDIIHAAVCAHGWLTTTRTAELNDAFEEHLKTLIVEESLGLKILASTMRHKLEALLGGGDFRPAFVCALLEVWSAQDFNPAIAGDPERWVSSLEARATPPDYIDIRYALELIEAAYRHTRISNEDAGTALVSRYLPLLERMLALPNLSPDSIAGIGHHWGKALIIIGDVASAQEQFERVMAGPVKMDATRLQLIRIYANDPSLKDIAERYADEILDRARTPKSVAGSVVLGLAQSLTSFGAMIDGVYDRHADVFDREIKEATDAGIDQGYAALAALARSWGWREPARLARLVKPLSFPEAESVNIRTRQSLGEILGQAALGSDPFDRDLQEKALTYFEAIPEPSDFERQKHSQILIEMKEFDRADDVLAKVADVRSKPFAAHRLSQVRLGQSRADEALELINSSIDLITAKIERFRPTFLAHRGKIRLTMGDHGGIHDYDRAIPLCDTDDFRTKLERERSEWLATQMSPLVLGSSTAASETIGSDGASR